MAMKIMKISENECFFFLGGGGIDVFHGLGYSRCVVFALKFLQWFHLCVCFVLLYFAMLFDILKETVIFFMLFVGLHMFACEFQKAGTSGRQVNRPCSAPCFPCLKSSNTISHTLLKSF